MSALVSIIIPAYNAELYIKEAIESVLKQTYKNWELIIIDDGSSDNSKTIITSFNDERIRYLYQQNQGVSVARNRGIELAKGTYITFLDADDALPERSIEVKLNFFEKNKNIDLVQGKVSIRDERLLKELKVYSTFKYINLFEKIKKLDNRLSFNPNYMIKQSLIGESRFKEGMTHCEDILFLLTLFANSKNLKYAAIDEITYHYRTSSTSAMANIDAMIEGYQNLLKNTMELPSIMYKDTIIIRMKAIRIMLSWYIRNGQFSKIKNIFNVLFLNNLEK